MNSGRTERFDCMSDLLRLPKVETRGKGAPLRKRVVKLYSRVSSLARDASNRALGYLKQAKAF